MMDQLSQLECGVRRAVEQICPGAVLINVNDDDTLDEVQATPAVHAAVTGGKPIRVVMNRIAMKVRLSCIVIVKHLGGEEFRRLASYPIVSALTALLPIQELEYIDDDGEVKPVEAGELEPAGFTTIAENKFGIAFRIEFDSVVEFDTSEDGASALLEILNRYNVDGKGAAEGLTTFSKETV